jgi:hypothetical protein
MCVCEAGFICACTNEDSTTRELHRPIKTHTIWTSGQRTTLPKLTSAPQTHHTSRIHRLRRRMRVCGAEFSCACPNKHYTIGELQRSIITHPIWTRDQRATLAKLASTLQTDSTRRIHRLRKRMRVCGAELSCACPNERSETSELHRSIITHTIWTNVHRANLAKVVSAPQTDSTRRIHCLRGRMRVCEAGFTCACATEHSTTSELHRSIITNYLN